jgi:hypothetical protein
MKYTFRKYAFGSKGAATTKINALGVDEEGNPTHKHTIAVLGNIVLAPAVLDEEGNVITEAVLSETYNVDVLWRDGVDATWDNQMVWPNPIGVHSFGNSEANAEYTATLYALFPDRVPVIDNDLND